MRWILLLCLGLGLGLGLSLPALADLDYALKPRLIADDFTEFGASGGIWNKADLVEQLPRQPFTQRTISEFAVKPLSENTALVTYQCHTAASNSRRSSIWRKQDEQWQMVFHQGTFFL